MPSVGDMDIFWNDTFEPGVTETGQWLVKYSISETPHCLLLLFYFDKQEICNLPSRIITLFSDASLILRQTHSSTLIDQ